MKHVQIARGLLFLTSTIRELLALGFNPGNTTTMFSTAEQGLSLLIYKTRSGDDKSTIRMRELAEEMTKNTRTLADAEKLTNTIPGQPRTITISSSIVLAPTAPSSTPCAGHATNFQTLCYAVWTTLDSDHVADRRKFFLSPTFCRQITRAIIKDGRSYFFQCMTPDDFLVEDVDEIDFPTSTLNEILRHQTPLVQSTFPLQWAQSPPNANIQTPSMATIPIGAPPITTVTATHSTATVVSAITSPTVNTAASRTQQQGSVCDTNVHPKIKVVMAP